MFLVTFAVGEVDDLAEGCGDDATGFFALSGPHHCVGFAAAGLPVRKDGAIVALDHTVHQGESCLLVDVALQGVRPKHVVEGERFRAFLHSRLE